MVNLPAHLTYKSALALIPPPSIIAPIEAIRRVHDRQFARWPPHINLCYPFLEAPSDIIVQDGRQVRQLRQDIRMRIERATRKIQPFQESLNADSIGTFVMESTKEKAVWLGPITRSIQDLQAALKAEFTECSHARRVYTPHLSIGQADTKYAVGALSAEIRTSVTGFLTNREENAPIALDWYTDKVFVVEREGYHDRFKVIGSIDLMP